MDWSRLWAMTGSITFSSKLPCWFAIVMATSFPVTWAQTIIIISHITGFTLPGMMLEPGWSAGRDISPSPAIGPLFIQRRSLAIFMKDEAVVFRCPHSSTAVSMVAWAAKWLSVSYKGEFVRPASLSATILPKSFGALMPVPTAVPPIASFARRGRHGFDAFDALRDLKGPAADLLAETDRHGIHKMRAAGLDDVVKLRLHAS